MINICFLVEGYAEERFVNDALIPYLQSKTSKILNVTVQNLQGGISFAKLVVRLKNLLPQYHIVTTLVDLVALDAAKINGYAEIMRDTALSSHDKAIQVENNLGAMVVSDNFIPYVQPYEFEALCFADIDGLAMSDPFLKRNIAAIKTILHAYNDNPENINTIPSKYPAKQLEQFGYAKGATNFAQYCNIEQISMQCRHFNDWVIMLINRIELSNN